MTHSQSDRLSLQRISEQMHARVGLTHYSAVEFLIALVALLVLTPLIEGLPSAPLVEGILLTIVLGSAVLAVGADRRSLIIATVLSVPAILAKWMHHFLPDQISAEATAVAALLFVSFVVYRLLKYILTASQVHTDVLCAGIATYLTFGLLWTFAYLLVSRTSPSAFSIGGVPGTRALTAFDTLYFSYVTLSTVGFGDITPVSPAARMLAVLEALTGTIYLAVLVARLVSMSSATVKPSNPERPPM